MKLLRFSEYNDNWPKEFETIKQRLESVLINLYKEIHHVGSTSVKGLGAKPIIDIDIEYEEEAHLKHIIKILEHNNYQYQGEKGIKNRHAFRYLKSDLYEHHLYAIQSGEAELLKHLKFRDTLRRIPIFRTKYQDLKQALIKQNNKDREFYTNSKTTLINQIMRKSDDMKEIVFAGGCFWGVEAYFKMIEGVIDTEVGYIAGEGETSYQDVCKGSGHAEAVLIMYDQERVSMKKLLDHLFNIIDPTSINKQGPDIGVQYRTGIYNYADDELSFIENYIVVRQKEFNKPIVLELKNNLPFYKAEDYHQDYLDKNTNGYCHVDLNSHKNVK